MLIIYNLFNIINAFISPFCQFNASFLNKSIDYFKKNILLKIFEW